MAETFESKPGDQPVVDDIPKQLGCTPAVIVYFTLFASIIYVITKVNI